MLGLAVITFGFNCVCPAGDFLGIKHPNDVAFGHVLKSCYKHPIIDYGFARNIDLVVLFCTKKFAIFILLNKFSSEFFKMKLAIVLGALVGDSGEFLAETLIVGFRNRIDHC